MPNARVHQLNVRRELTHDWVKTLFARVKSEKFSRFLPTIVVLLTIMGFLPALRNGFINWQDAANLIENTKYRGFSWNHVGWMLTTVEAGYYQPFTWLTFAVDHLLWNGDPFGYHLTSLLLHGANAGFLYVVVVQLLAHGNPDPSGFKTPALRWSAVCAVLLFSLHPIRVEAVGWASARNILLAALFQLVALTSYLRAAHSGANKTAYWTWIGVSMAAHLFSILSGANGLALPMVLVLLDIYLLRRLEPRRPGEGRHAWATALLKKSPFFVLGIARIITVATLRDMPAASETANIPIWERVTRAVYEPLFYLWKTAVPRALLPAYAWPEVIEVWQAALTLGGFVMVSFAMGLWSIRSERGAPMIAWLSYLVLVFVPGIQSAVDIVHVPADRNNYLPSFVLGLVTTSLLWHLFQSLGARKVRQSGFATAASAILSAVIVLEILTWQQLTVWHDAGKLWKHAVAVAPQSTLARHRLADLLVEQGQDREAVEIFRQAIVINPNSALAHVDLANALTSRGQIPEAGKFYWRALEIRPNLLQGLFGMGNYLALQGDFAGAIEHYREALASAPSAAYIHVNLGYALSKLGQWDQAIDHYRAAVRMDSTNVNAYFNLASAHTARGQLNAAMENYRRALKIVPSHTKAHYGLANLLVKSGERKEAIEHFQEAIKFAPDFAEPYHDLGTLLAEDGRLDSAVEYYRHALGIRPTFAEARLSLARALAAQGKKQEALREYEEAKRLLQDGGSSSATRERNRG
jgi:protein O-mannosyl-transferase